MNEIDAKAGTDLDQLKKKALLFVWIAEIWNLLEAGVWRYGRESEQEVLR